VPIDPKSLPKDPEILQQMLVDVTTQLDKTQRLLRQLLAARSGVRSEQISADQLALFAHELGIDSATTAAEQESKDEDRGPDPPAGNASGEKKPRGRQALPRHLKRERIIHDLAEADKHCSDCQQTLRRIGEEVSERYEYIPAQMLVIEDACQKYACACKIRTAGKPAQPIEKSTASASVLAQVIVSKVADHLPVHRQAKIFRRFGLQLPDQTLCGWLRQSAELLEPLYQELKRFLLRSKVVGTDDTPVKVLDRLLPHTRTGRFWPYVGDHKHLAVVYDYTPTRERAGPEKFLSTYKGYLQLDAYPAYDKFFVEPARELVEVGCFAHARRHVYQARETDPARMGLHRPTVRGGEARPQSWPPVGRLTPVASGRLASHC
jgi:transposase